jgi:hypothetical protein
MTQTPEQLRSEAVDAVAMIMVRLMDAHALGVAEEALLEISTEANHEAC